MTSIGSTRDGGREKGTIAMSDRENEHIDAPEIPQCCQDMAGRIDALEKRVDALEAAQPYQRRNALDSMDIWAGD